MSINNFIPTIWSARLLKNLDKAHVFAQVVNRDYEGEIKQQGDKVKINSIGPVTIGDYTKNTNIGDPETLTSTQQELEITEAKYFNFQVDDIDRAQQKPKIMDAAMQRSAYGLNDISDNFLASFYVGVHAENVIGDDSAPVVPTKTDAYERLVDLSVLLDEQNVPKDGRFAILPPWYEGLLLKDDRFVKAGTNDSAITLKNGFIGQAAGFALYKSNNIANTTKTKYKIMAGHPMAISFAEQIVSVEAYRPEKRFADAVKGLHVYGAKLVQPKAIAVMTANRA